MDLFPYISLWNLAAVAALMTAGWVVSLILRNVTVVDSLWGLGFVLVAWLTFALSEGFAGRRWLVAVLTTLWGLRLSAYLTRRNWGKGEDPRYGSWRQASGERFWIVSLFKVFWLQALFLWVISMVVQVPLAAAAPAHFTAWDAAGAVLWAAGFLFETVADAQLARFKADPANRGRVMDRGLWRYSRHPNYFGESLIWWGLFLIAFSVPGAWWTVACPALITLVLLKMTGVALTERTIVETRPAYRDYQRRTSTFIPWFPKEPPDEPPARAL
jgi:steroid 5-alpha reductase family enzyme